MLEMKSLPSLLGGKKKKKPNWSKFPGIEAV